jgi:hypothetical protein
MVKLNTWAHLGKIWLARGRGGTVTFAPHEKGNRAMAAERRRRRRKRTRPGRIILHGTSIKADRLRLAMSITLFALLAVIGLGVALWLLLMMVSGGLGSKPAIPTSY